MSPCRPPVEHPFQYDSGNHTSILMSEPAEGFTVAATRQKLTELLNARSEALRPICGRENAPAAITCASVMVVSGSVNEDRASHDPAALIVGSLTIEASSMVHSTAQRIL